MSTKFQVWYEATPNPQSMKFLVDQPIADESVQFDDPVKAERSPLAAKIFGFPWTSAVFVGPNFVTVTKQDWVDWETLAAPLSGLISEHLERGVVLLGLGHRRAQIELTGHQQGRCGDLADMHQG